MTGSSKKTNEQRVRILEDIRKLRKQDKSEEEIMLILAIEPRTWRRYINMIHREDKKAWFQVARTQLEPELLKFKSSLEDTYRISKKKAEESTETEDVLAARQAADDARLSIVQLITEGPDYIKHVDEYVQEKQKMDTKRKTEKQTSK